MSLRHTLQQSFRNQGLPLGTTDTDKLQAMIKQSVVVEEPLKFKEGTKDEPIKSGGYEDRRSKTDKGGFLKTVIDFGGKALGVVKEYGGKIVDYAQEKGFVEKYFEKLVESYKASKGAGVPSPAKYSGQYKQIPKKAAQTIDSRVAPFQKGPVAVSRSAQQGNYYASNLANAVNSDKDAVAFIASQLLDVNKANLPDISTQINVTKAPVVAATTTNPNITT